MKVLYSTCWLCFELIPYSCGGINLCHFHKVLNNYPKTRDELLVSRIANGFATQIEIQHYESLLSTS